MTAIMRHAFKHSKHATPSSRPTPIPPAGTGKTRWIILGLCLFATAGATWAVMEFVVWNKLPSELLGKWVVQNGEQEGATFDFFRNGTMIAQINNRGNMEIVKAEIMVEGDTLFMTTFHPMTKEPMTKKHTITTITANRLVLRDEQQNVYRMERASR